MRPLKYSINLTADGCCHHESVEVTEAMHRYHERNVGENDAILLGRVTYQMMEAGWRDPAFAAERPVWMQGFADVMNATKKYVVSSTLRDDPGWNAEVLKGDLRAAVQEIKEQPGTGIGLGGVTLPTALAQMGLIDEYEFVVHPRLVGHGPYLFSGLQRFVDLRLVDKVDVGDGAVAMKYASR